MVVDDVDRPYVGTLTDAERDRVVLTSQLAAHGIVERHDLRPVDVVQVLGEAVDDAGERSMMVEVIRLDVGQDRPVQGQFEMCAVTLVGLDDQPAG